MKIVYFIFSIMTLITLINNRKFYAKKKTSAKDIELKSEQECETVLECKFNKHSEDLIDCPGINYCQISILSEEGLGNEMKRKYFCWQKKNNKNCKNNLSDFSIKQKELQSIYNEFELDAGKVLDSLDTDNSLLDEEHQQIKEEAENIFNESGYKSNLCHLIYDGKKYVNKKKEEDELSGYNTQVETKITEIDQHIKKYISLYGSQNSNEWSNVEKGARELIKIKDDFRNKFKIWHKRTKYCWLDMLLFMQQEIKDNIEKGAFGENYLEIANKQCKSLKEQYKIDLENNKVLCKLDNGESIPIMCSYDYENTKKYFLLNEGEKCEDMSTNFNELVKNLNNKI
jgi:hypothetical protein